MSVAEIKICDCHTERVPLLWTFKFRGAEYWCPACGYTSGMFGAGKNVKATEALLKKHEELKEETKAYLSGETEKWEYKL